MSSSPPATLTAEEVEAVTMSGEALLQLASRLNGVAFLPSSTSQAGGRMRGDHDSHDGGGDAPFVTVEDGAGFMELLRDVIEHCPANLQARDESHYEQRECGAHNEGRSPHAATMLQKRLLALHHVVFGLQPELLATVLSLLHAPHMMTDGDAVCHLFPKRPPVAANSGVLVLYSIRAPWAGLAGLVCVRRGHGALRNLHGPIGPPWRRGDCVGFSVR
ncbi:casein kinase II, alpha chain [Trypanosoma cruzi]|nr:casein kinase II, alpha chain [Trypanosoma cruzi]